MPYEVSVTRTFSGAHQLRLYDGTYEPLHGHNFDVEVVFGAPELDAMSVAVDFCAVEAALGDVLGALHNSNLNDNPALASVNPSAELIARHVFDTLGERLADMLGTTRARLMRVTVSEAQGCRASYIAPHD